MVTDPVLLPTPRPGEADVCDPERLTALAATGMGAAPDPDMDHLAHRVRAQLGVPVALVSLVQADRQVFPGMAGLPDPWARERATPLRQSLCRHVVATAHPLVVRDLLTDPRVVVSAVAREVGVAAYAGYPLTDAAGRVLGALAAVDTAPRDWTTAELDTLADLARSATSELRLRLARHDAAGERTRSDAAEAGLRAAVDREQALLRAAHALAGVTTVDGLRRCVGWLVADALAPTSTALLLTDGSRRLRRVPDPAATGAHDLAGPPLAAPLPAAAAARDARVVHHGDRADLHAAFPAATAAHPDLHAVLCVPLRGATGTLGVLELGWDRPYRVDAPGLALIATVAGYAAQALERADVLEHRASVAAALQTAMLTELPAVDGLSLAARYVPADRREYVGGDWYDAVPASGAGGDRVLAVTVGDVTGHGIGAASVMGQVRSMLRQAGWQAGGAGPAATLSALETAVAGVGLAACGSAVHTHLRAVPGGRWAMSWTNAGHPPPVLLPPDGDPVVLAAHDMVFGYTRTPPPRRDHHVLLAPGTTVLLYTDGLVERRGRDIDAGVDALCAALRDLRGHPAREVADTVVGRLVEVVSADDVVALALRVDG